MATLKCQHNLKSRWPDAHVHFIDDEHIHSQIQWIIQTDESSVLGDFVPGGISFQAHSDHEFAEVALWFRQIVPATHRLLYCTDSLNTAPFELKPGMTEEEVIEASHREFDEEEFQNLIDMMSD